MEGITIFGIFLVVWGFATGLVAIFKPKKLWEMGKIQGFVQLLGDTGAMIFFLIAGLVAIGAGIWILV